MQFRMSLNKKTCDLQPIKVIKPCQDLCLHYNPQLVTIIYRFNTLFLLAESPVSRFGRIELVYLVSLNIYLYFLSIIYYIVRLF